MMNILSMVVAMLNVRQWLGDVWRNLARLWQAWRNEGRLQRLHRKVRRLERQATSLHRRMHPNRTRQARAGFRAAVDADWC